MKQLSCLVLACLFFHAAAAQTFQDTLAKVETIFARYTSHTPGCQLTIARRGQVVLSKAWGLADLEHDLPLSTESIIEAGSVSKQFTAAAILLLEQQGRLSLQDDVRKYLPELPAYGRPIQLRHLLHHTSGLRDWGSVAELTGWGRSKKFYTNTDALDIVVHQKSLNNQPGDEFIYSNSNYNLLAIIVQRVSGLSLAEFTRQHIFAPAGMAHTQWRDNPNRLVANRAVAYRKVASGYETDMPNEYVYGNGGLLTTTEDLIKWQAFYLQGKLGTASLLAKQTQTEPLTSGATNEYGAGLFIRSVAGLANISHGGATAGYRAYLEVFPATGLSIALLSNTSHYDITSVATELRTVFVAPPPTRNTARGAAGQLPAAILSSYAGWYRNNRDGSALHLTLQNGQLLANNQVRLVAQTERRFGMNSQVLEREGPAGLRIIFPNRDTVRYAKVAPALAADHYAAYVGRYFSEETSSFLTVVQQDGALKIRFKPSEEFTLVPTFKDSFAIPDQGIALQFTKQERDAIVLKISSSRARNVEFNKLPAAQKGSSTAGTVIPPPTTY